jgi:dTDP-4-dehydrorhamnose 3,5-epimerase
MGFELSSENLFELLIPAGFGHGYLVEEDSIVSYKCAEIFYAEYDSGIIWNDETINVKWPLEKVVGSDIIVSQKDKMLPTFKEFFSNKK